MHLLFTYLRRYWPLLGLALLLAAINQVFSLLDPYIFRKITDQYIVRPDGTLHDLSFWGFLGGGAGVLILQALGVAMVSRIAKNFLDYYSITQRLGTRHHSLDLPYR
jgi:ATP-binding cassette subfamily B protein